MQSADQRRDDRRQRGRLLGLELGRPSGDRELDRSATTRPGSCRTAKTPVTARRRRTAVRRAETAPTRTPRFTSTNIARCTIFRENLVTENNNLEVPANPSTERRPGASASSSRADDATTSIENTITKNVNNGVLGFEYPNPYPPQPKARSTSSLRATTSRTTRSPKTVEPAARTQATSSCRAGSSRKASPSPP